MEAIIHTVRHGVRNDTDNDAHYSEMPAFADLLEKEEIAATIEYVLSLSKQEHDQTLVPIGAELFADNCSSCHGDAGLGDPDMGAPNLADAIWLYGGNRDALSYTIENARFGVMPAWGQRLSEEDVRAVSAYVHALGGGE
jgi:cytochrome c oxidase cbb3-type subunit 3